MAMQNLNQVEINEVSGALSLTLSLGSLTIDPASIISSAVSSAESTVSTVLGMLPPLPTFTIPLVNVSVGATAG